MSNRRIKGTHVPRLALALAALSVFFVTLYYELIGQSIDFTQPTWAAVMVGFLFAGVVMLVTSWIIGLDSRAELMITLFMVAVHLCFDAFIFVQVFALHRALPVTLVQLVVQAYWIAGLIDVVLMYWASNWERTASVYVSPEQQIASLRQELALRDAALLQVSKDADRASKQAQRLLEDANRVYTASCEGCGRVFSKPTQAQADAARDGHKRACKVAIVVSSNGHKHEPIPEILERSNG